MAQKFTAEETLKIVKKLEHNILDKKKDKSFIKILF